MSLYENKITEIPSEIGDIESLTSLNLSSNKIKSIPPEIGKLVGLVEFFIYNNELEEIPKEIGKLSGLTLIDVSENKIKEIPSEIGQCIELNQINFGENELEEIPDSIGNCDKLEMLKLSHNKLTKLPTSIQELIDLKELHVEGNQIDSLQSELDEVIENLLIFSTEGNPFHTKVGVPNISPAEFEEVIWVMLCSGGVFKKYNRKGKTVNRLVYLDHKTMRLQCRDAKRDRDERDSIPIDKLQEVHVGMKTATLKKYGKSIKEDCYLSLVSPTVTLDLETTPEQREEWAKVFKQTINYYKEHPVVLPEESNPLSPRASRRSNAKPSRSSSDLVSEDSKAKRKSIFGVVGTIGKKKKKRSDLLLDPNRSDSDLDLDSDSNAVSDPELSPRDDEPGSPRSSDDLSPRASPSTEEKLPRSTSKRKLNKKNKSKSKKALRAKDKKSATKSKLANEVKPTSDDSTKIDEQTEDTKDDTSSSVTSSDTKPVEDEKPKSDKEPEPAEPVKEDEKPKSDEKEKEPEPDKEQEQQKPKEKEPEPVLVSEPVKEEEKPKPEIIGEEKKADGPTRAKVGPKASILSRISMFEQPKEEPSPVVSRKSPVVSRPVSMFQQKSPLENSPTSSPTRAVEKATPVLSSDSPAEKSSGHIEVKQTYGGQTSAGNVRSRLSMFEAADAKAQKESAVLKGQRDSEMSTPKKIDVIDKAEAERIAQEEERRAKELADKKAKEEEERKVKEEADRIAKEEADKKAKEEAERKAKEDADRKAKEEEERKAKEEADRKAKEEADRIAKEEAERKAKEEERKAREEEERKKLKTEEERKAFEEKTRKEREERERKEEEERKAKEEADRKAKEEADRKAKEEADRKAKEEAERKAKEEADRKAKEEADKKAKEEAERKAKEEADRKAKEEAERKAKEEADRKAKEEADKKAKEEADRKAKEEADKKAEADKEIPKETTVTESDKPKKKVSIEISPAEEDEDDENDESRTPKIAKRVGGVAGRRLPTRKGGGKLATEAAARLQEAEEKRQKQMEEIARRREENMKRLEEEEEKLAKMTPEERQALEEKEKEEQKKQEEEDYAERLAREEKEREEKQRMELEKQKAEAIKGALGTLKKVEARKRQEPASRLICLKGKRRVRVHLVEVSAKSLNHGDVFILDKKTTMFIWNGKKANRMEKAKGAELTLRFKNQERKGANVVRIDPGDTDEEFWKELGGTENDVRSAEDGGNDIDYERECDARVKLYRIERNEESDSDEYSLIEVETKRLSREALATDGCFILDCQTEIFVWIGKNSTSSMRNFAMNHAKENFLESRPDWTHFARNVEGGEEILFREKFAEWPDIIPGVRGSSRPSGPASSKAAGGSSSASSGGGDDGSSGGKTLVRRRSMLMGRIKKQEAKIDVNKLHTSVRPEQELLGDGTPGTIEAWIGIDGKLAEETDLLEGHFYSEESYVILYTFHKGNALRYHVYFWQGIDASKQDKGLTALLVKEIQVKVRKEKGAEPFQERVTPLKEPYQFLHIFKGKFIVHKGKKSDHKSSSKINHLYRIQSHIDDVHTRAIEIDANASLLNSRDNFIIQTSSKQYRWFGSGSTEDQKQRAVALFEPLVGTRSVKNVNEGSEDKKFWKLLSGNKKSYANASHLKKKGWEPRFYYCTGTGNSFKVDPVWDVIQQELESTCVLIVDVVAEVYVWAGPSAPEETKKKAMETATEYVRAAFDGRLQNTPIYLVPSGQESNSFVALFPAWHDKVNLFIFNSFLNYLTNFFFLLKNNQPREGKMELVSDKLKDYDREYSWEELTAKNKPKGLDYKHLEVCYSFELFFPFY